MLHSFCGGELELESINICWMQGTLDYMAPEVLACTDRDRPDLAYGLSADIWALGAMLHELMLGRTPFCHADILVTIKVCPAETLCMISACKATSLDSLVTLVMITCAVQQLMKWAVLQGIVENEVSIDGTSMSATAQDFILQCLRKDPQQRPSITDLLQHPWMEVIIENSVLHTSVTSLRKLASLLTFLARSRQFPQEADC